MQLILDTVELQFHLLGWEPGFEIQARFQDIPSTKWGKYLRIISIIDANNRILWED